VIENGDHDIPMIEIDFKKPAPKPSSIEEGHAIIDANCHQSLFLW
jgi:hypothetical protein